MVFADIVAELKRLDAEEANQDLDNLGQKMILITCMIVCPNKIQELGIATVVDITEAALQVACETVVTAAFSEKFQEMCRMENIPDVNLQ